MCYMLSVPNPCHPYPQILMVSVHNPCHHYPQILMASKGIHVAMHKNIRGRTNDYDLAFSNTSRNSMPQHPC